MNPLLAVLCHPLSGMLLSYLLPVALLAFFVEVFVRSTEPRPAMAARRVCLRAISAFAALGAGVLAFSAAVPVFAGWRRNAALAVFCVLAALSLSAFLSLLLPLALLPEAAINWWFD